MSSPEAHKNQSEEVSDPRPMEAARAAMGHEVEMPGGVNTTAHADKIMNQPMSGGDGTSAGELVNSGALPAEDFNKVRAEYTPAQPGGEMAVNQLHETKSLPPASPRPQ